MKLEAVDRKNPHFICPATVGALRGVEVLVTFDGWQGAFDYYCRFDSRDIFPVGWCNLTGDNLQPPGTKGLDSKNIKYIAAIHFLTGRNYFLHFLFMINDYLEKFALSYLNSIKSQHSTFKMQISFENKYLQYHISFSLCISC